MNINAINAAIHTQRDAARLLTEADAAFREACPPYVLSALTYRGLRDADRERLAAIVPNLPGPDAIQPATLSPHDAYSSGFLGYTVEVEDWIDVVTQLRAQHPPVPLAVFSDSCTSFRPEAGSYRDRSERMTVSPVSDFVIKADAVADYPHTVMIQWWTEIGPGVTVRIDVHLKHHTATGRVRYTLLNPTRSGRQHPEDRRWSCSWTWGAGSNVRKWYTTPGNRPPHSWTWPAGTDILHAIKEDK